MLTGQLRPRDRCYLLRYPLLPARSRHLGQDLYGQCRRHCCLFCCDQCLAPGPHAILHGKGAKWTDGRDMGRQRQCVVQNLPRGSHHHFELDLVGFVRKNPSPCYLAQISSLGRVLASRRTHRFAQRWQLWRCSGKIRVYYYGALSLIELQFYLSCAQIKVQNGGSGSPSPLVSFPGAYKASDAGILVNIYYPIPQDYKPPGPAVWRG